MSDKPWIITYTGKKFVLEAVTPDMIDIVDIAHALARLPHWNGHTYGEYAFSVAQHSIMVAWLMRGIAPMHGLLHDAEEAYLGDITRPLKSIIIREWPEFDGLIFAIRSAIYTKYVGEPPSAAIAEYLGDADNLMLCLEADTIVNTLALEKHGWPRPEITIDLRPNRTVPWADYSFDYLREPWPAAEAERRFLDAFYRISGMEATNE